MEKTSTPPQLHEQKNYDPRGAQDPVQLFDLWEPLVSSQNESWANLLVQYKRGSMLGLVCTTTMSSKGMKPNPLESLFHIPDRTAHGLHGLRLFDEFYLCVRSFGVLY